jgi:hypothetical protein
MTSIINKHTLTQVVQEQQVQVAPKHTAWEENKLNKQLEKRKLATPNNNKQTSNKKVPKPKYKWARTC